MRDTDRAFQQLYRQKIMERSGAERFRMGDGMFAAARSLALAALSDLRDDEKPFELFLRFYGNDFSPEHRQRIKNSLLGRPK
jgi:hypothetical protein